MSSSAEIKEIDRARDDAIQIALPGKMAGQPFWTRREDGTLVVTRDRIEFFPSDHMHAVWSVRYPVIESIELNGFLGRRIVTIQTKDGPLNIRCRASARLISQLVAFVNARIGAVAEEERLGAKYALTKLRPNAEHIAASGRLDEDVAAALQELFGEKETEQKNSSPIPGGQRDAELPAETETLRRILREVGEHPNAPEQSGKQRSVQRIAAEHAVEGGNSASKSRKGGDTPATPTAKHALTKLGTDTGDPGSDSVLLELLPQAESLFSDNRPAAKRAAASYLLARLMVDLDRDVGHSHAALQTLFPQTEKVFASQHPAAKLAGARHALTRLGSEGAEHDDMLLEVFQELENVFVGDGPAAKFGAAKYALTKLRVGSDERSAPNQEVNVPTGSLTAHRVRHSPHRIEEDQFDAPEHLPVEDSPGWRLRRVSRRLRNAAAASEGDDLSGMVLPLLLLLVFIPVAGSTILYRPADVNGSSSKTGSDSVTAYVERESRPADVGAAPITSPSDLTEPTASPMDVPELQPTASEIEVSRKRNLYRDKHQLVGRMIARQRSAMGLSQAELAIAVGQSEESIASLENGDHRADPVDLLKIAKMIDLNFYDVLNNLQ